jgi:CheY-like chemotaxis protein
MDVLMKILIVEDNPAMRRVIRRMIEDFADEVIECSDGAEAFVLYAEKNPDWVLMDIEMTEVDGITTTRRIKTDFPEAKILIVTNYDDTGLRHAADQAGACGYVLKDNLFVLSSFLK